MNASRCIALVASFIVLMATVPMAAAAVFNGAGDNQIDALGYYYAITGGKFPNGQTVNGTKTSGGSMAFILDDPDWQSWDYNYEIDVWHKDGWFAETAGLALTMKSQGATVFDNFNNDAGNFYTVPQGQPTEDTPGMYRGYSMSNNFDWIYAGYFKLAEETTIDTIIGYFDPTYGFDPNSPLIAYRMNIWSNQDVDKGTYIEKRPVLTGSFDGDIFCTDREAGTFTWGDTGVDRVFGAEHSHLTDDIWYLQFALASPITLPAGEYWFSHDATIIPEPTAILIWSVVFLGFGSVGGWWRRRGTRTASRC